MELLHLLITELFLWEGEGWILTFHYAKCYGWRWGCWDREERVEGSGGDVRATVPAALQYPRVLFTWWWRWLGLGALGEAGRGASPTAGKREGIFF